MVPAVNALARRSASIRSTQPAIGSHTNSGNPGTNPNGSSTTQGRPFLERSGRDNSRSSGLVSVRLRRALIGGVNRPSVLPSPEADHAGGAVPRTPQLAAGFGWWLTLILHLT